MPRLNELQSLYAEATPLPTHAFGLVVEETLVPDRRSRQSTSQILEDKLRRLTRYRKNDALESSRPCIVSRP